MGALLQSMTNVKQRADGWWSQAAADSRSKQTRASDEVIEKNLVQSVAMCSVVNLQP